MLSYFRDLNQHKCCQTTNLPYCLCFMLTSQSVMIIACDIIIIIITIIIIIIIIINTENWIDNLCVYLRGQ